MPYGVRWPLVQVSAGVKLGPGNVYVLNTFAVLEASVSLGGSIRGMVAAPVLSKLGLPGAGLPSSVRRRILPSGYWRHSTSNLSSLAEVAVAFSLARASANPPP